MVFVFCVSRTLFVMIVKVGVVMSCYEIAHGRKITENGWQIRFKAELKLNLETCVCSVSFKDSDV